MDRRDPGFVFLGANTPWVYALCRALTRRGAAVTAIAPYDAGNFRRLRPRWPAGEPPAGLRRAFWVYPPGYAGKLAKIFAPFLSWRLAWASRGLAGNGGGTTTPPWTVAVFPWFLQAVRKVPAARLIYYNLDDYELYQPARAVQVRRQEKELIERARLTICLSRWQTEILRARCPQKSCAIHHFPLGVVESLLNPHPESVPTARTVGYVGNLIDRVDWRLVAAVADRLPEIEFVFIGDLAGFGGGGTRPDWMADRDMAFKRSNIRRVGHIAQEEVATHYWNFGVNWIPYDPEHAFNQASCPTKIMDGIASGRPIVSTDIPECRLYPEWITVVDSAEAAADAIRRLFQAMPSAEHAGAQVTFARGHTWEERSKTLDEWLAHG